MAQYYYLKISYNTSWQTIPVLTDQESILRDREERKKENREEGWGKRRTTTVLRAQLNCSLAVFNKLSLEFI